MMTECTNRGWWLDSEALGAGVSVGTMDANGSNDGVSANDGPELGVDEAVAGTVIGGAVTRRFIATTTAAAPAPRTTTAGARSRTRSKTDLR